MMTALKNFHLILRMKKLLPQITLLNHQKSKRNLCAKKTQMNKQINLKINKNKNNNLVLSKMEKIIMY